MSRPNRKNKDVPLTVYEQRREEQIEMNNQKLEALNLPRLNTSGQNVQPSKRTKITQQSSDAATEGHNLRTRSQRNHAGNVQAEDPNYQPTRDQLCNNEDHHNSPPKKKRKGRSITMLDNIFARTPDMPKIKIIINEFGQPVGENARQFSNAIGCQVRKTLSVGCADWRLVDIEKKDKVWDALKLIYDIDEEAKSWFMVNAARKWKEFKATLKADFFNEKITHEQLQKKHGDRVKDSDWSFLIKHWSSAEFEDRMEISKANRAKLGIYHTSGSKSFACLRHEMGSTLGRPPRRDEVYIRTHTRKSGVPTPQAEPIINKLKSVVEAHPELTERTIQQGDVFAVACGEKEPRGQVRGLGLGPTPQDVGTPGLKCYKPTKLQMEVLARKKAENEKATLLRRIQELEEEREARIVQERRNVEINSQNGSNSQNHVSPRSEGHINESYHAQPLEDDVSTDNDEDSDHYDEDGYLLIPRSRAAQSAQPATSLSAQRAAALSAKRAAALPVQPVPSLSALRAAALSVRQAPGPSVHPTPCPSEHRVAASTHPAPSPSLQSVVVGSTDLPQDCSPTSPIKTVAPPKKNNAPRVSPKELVGKEVTLYAMLRQERVATAVVISTNPIN